MTYYLRTTDKDGKAYGGFQWPVQVGAVVEAPDWSPEPECGNGLHGLKDGLGGAQYLSWDADALWWIVEADEAVCIDGDKWKFPRCTVVAVGTRAEVTAELYRLRPGPIHGLIMSGGDGATLTGGDGATLTGGNGATLTGGDGATLTGGDGATLTGGDDATLIFLRWIGGRRRVLAAYVGEDGIEPGVACRANYDHTKVVRAEA